MSLELLKKHIENYKPPLARWCDRFLPILMNGQVTAK